MGKGRDKRKKKKGSSTAGLGHVKTQRKTAKNELKTERRIERRLEADEEDIDSLLAKFKLEDERRTKICVEDNCDPPSIERDGVIMVFGGEHEDPRTQKVCTYNDLYKFSCERNKWTKIASPNGPSPRSSHQTVYYKNALYLFGGEFTSPGQDRFKHFREVWRFDLKTSGWDRYDARKGPTGRSGHRAIVYQNKMIVFGGFNDSGDDPVYYDDLWVFHLDDLVWESVDRTSGPRPSKRSGFRMVSHGDFAYIYGGYTRFRDEEDKDVEHGKIVDDMWRLDLTTYKFEKVKKNGVAPGERSGFNMAVHGHRAILFGGATDNEAKQGMSIVSDFHNDLFQFNFDRQRWYTVSLRATKPKKDDRLLDPEAAAAVAEEQERTREHKAATTIQANYRGYSVRKAFKVYKLGGKVPEMLYSPAAYGFDLSIQDAPKPKGRISAGMCVVKNKLWIFGGAVEIMDREITLDDVWYLSLKNYDGWHCVKQNTVGEEVFAEAADEVSDSSEEDSEEDGSDESTN